MKASALWAATLLLCLSLCVQAALPAASQTQRYHALLEELRCLVCQNESLAESNAELAEDLRAEIRGLMASGATNAEIIDFLVARYGDFILYRPRVRPITYLLWFGPFLLAMAGLGLLIYKISRRARREEQPLSSEEQRRLRELLSENTRGD